MTSEAATETIGWDLRHLLEDTPGIGDDTVTSGPTPRMARPHPKLATSVRLPYGTRQPDSRATKCSTCAT